MLSPRAMSKRGISSRCNGVDEVRLEIRAVSSAISAGTGVLTFLTVYGRGFYFAEEETVRC